MFGLLKSNFTHIPCRAPTTPSRANSHMPCCAFAVIQQCHVRTANRETPRGSRKKSKLGRSATGRRQTDDVNSHIPCGAPAVLCPGLGKALAKRHGQSTAGARHGMCESNTVAPRYWNGKDTIWIFTNTARHGMCKLVLRNTWVASDLQQTPTSIKLPLPGYRHLTPISSAPVYMPWYHDATNADMSVVTMMCTICWPRTVQTAKSEQNYGLRVLPPCTVTGFLYESVCP